MFGFLLEGRRAIAAGTDNAAPLNDMNSLRFMEFLFQDMPLITPAALSGSKTMERLLCVQ
jgi:hypothetical protein